MTRKRPTSNSAVYWPLRGHWCQIVSRDTRSADPDAARYRILIGRRIATRGRLSLIHLIAALLIVAGLAISAPPTCWCAPDEHFGVLLHPLFPHAHGPAHTTASQQEDVLSATEVSRAASAVEAPAMSALTSDTGARDAVAGLLLPLLLAAMLVEISRRQPRVEPRPDERAVAPPTPPPRLLPSVA
jgi:hypothetical protein